MHFNTHLTCDFPEVLLKICLSVFCYRFLLFVFKYSKLY